jgi:hypothetical protein
MFAAALETSVSQPRVKTKFARRLWRAWAPSSGTLDSPAFRNVDTTPLMGKSFTRDVLLLSQARHRARLALFQEVTVEDSHLQRQRHQRSP